MKNGPRPVKLAPFAACRQQALDEIEAARRAELASVENEEMVTS